MGTIETSKCKVLITGNFISVSIIVLDVANHSNYIISYKRVILIAMQLQVYLIVSVQIADRKHSIVTGVVKHMTIKCT